MRYQRVNSLRYVSKEQVGYSEGACLWDSKRLMGERTGGLLMQSFSQHTYRWYLQVQAFQSQSGHVLCRSFLGSRVVRRCL